MENEQQNSIYSFCGCFGGYVCVFFDVHMPPAIFVFLDWLEVGNNKKALQEADKFLKKHPDVQCARALKALALVRLGRDAEADPLIDKLASESPSDDQTLQVVTYCYKEQEECKCKMAFGVIRPRRINTHQLYNYLEKKLHLNHANL